MYVQSYPLLKGDSLFRKDELVYINKSSELQEYMNLMHKHDFIEIAYVVSGSGKHVVGENQYDISKGDLFIINYDVPHGFFPKSEGKEGLIVYNCVFMPKFLDASLLSSINFQDIASSFLFKSLFPDNTAPLPDLNLCGTDFQEVGVIFNKMYAEYKAMEKGYCDIIRAYLIELIIKILRYMDTGKPKFTLPKNEELVNKAIEYLKHNYNTDVRLEDVAIRSFISKNYFSKLFKDVTGTSFSDYVQKLRVDEACSLLRNTDMKVTSIAMQIGINDMKFFYEVFKKITGKTPGDYRKN
jgi:AraC family transcriptional regulator, L-rhamnose operon transcriptional activator RhaR